MVGFRFLAFAETLVFLDSLFGKASTSDNIRRQVYFWGKNFT